MLDEVGTWYYKTAYSVLLSDENLPLTEAMTCELNSKVLDFYFKHITTVKAGGYYEYRSQYIERLPCVTEDSDGEFATLREKAREITDALDFLNRSSVGDC